MLVLSLGGCITVHVVPTKPGAELAAEALTAPNDTAGAMRLAAQAEREKAFMPFLNWQVEADIAWAHGTSQGKGTAKWMQKETDVAVLVDAPTAFRGGLAWTDGQLSIVPAWPAASGKPEGGKKPNTAKELKDREAARTASEKLWRRMMVQLLGEEALVMLPRVFTWTKGLRHEAGEEVVFHPTSGLPWRIANGEWSMDYLAWHLDGPMPLPAVVVLRRHEVGIQMSLQNWKAEKVATPNGPLTDRVQPVVFNR